MKLTSISIKNFKGIDENGITVKVAPITLLFGPNNAGKSTIIQALHLAREVFSAENPDFDKIESLNIGTFKDYVHNHDFENRSVSIKLEYEYTEAEIEDRECDAMFDAMTIKGRSARFNADKCKIVQEIVKFIKKIAIKFEIGWDTYKDKPQLQKYIIFINEKKLTDIKISPSFKTISSEYGEFDFLSIEPFFNANEYKTILDDIKNYTVDDLPEEYQKYNIDTHSKMITFIVELFEIHQSKLLESSTIEKIKEHIKQWIVNIYQDENINLSEITTEIEKSFNQADYNKDIRDLVFEMNSKFLNLTNSEIKEIKNFPLKKRKKNIISKIKKLESNDNLNIRDKKNITIEDNLFMPGFMFEYYDLYSLINRIHYKDYFIIKHLKAIQKISRGNPYYIPYLVKNITLKLLKNHKYLKGDIPFFNIVSFLKKYNSNISEILSHSFYEREFIYCCKNKRFSKPPNENVSSELKNIWNFEEENDFYYDPVIFDKPKFHEGYWEDNEKYGENSNFVKYIFKELDKLTHNLDSMLYMGAIREQVARGSIIPQKISKDRWQNGSALWDLLLTTEKNKLNLFNKNLQKLGLDYEIIQNKLYLLNDDSKLREKFNTMLKTGSVSDFKDEDISLIREFIQAKAETIIKLENTKTGVQTEIKDMGLGISQVMPIVGASVFAEKNAFIAIEEPESHIHPKLQVALGDVIIESALHSENTPTFLIETHSEHLLLRFLRRIRHTEEGKAEENLKITPEDIAVNWIGQTPTCFDTGIEKTTYCARLGIDKDGSFNTPWPEGFFDERGEELFE